MNTQELQHFDRNEFLRRMDGDEEDAAFILEHTKNTIETIISDFQEAIASEELEQVRAAAHKIKGTSRSLTFEILAEKALALEQLAATAKEESPEDSAEKTADRTKALEDIKRLADEIVDEFHFLKTLI